MTQQQQQQQPGSTTPQAQQRAASRPNKRRSRRQQPRSSTKVRAYRNSMGLGPNIGLALLDVSETGVRLLLKEQLKKGQEFEIQLESASRSIKLIGEVIWTIQTAEGQFCTGAHLQKCIPY